MVEGTSFMGLGGANLVKGATGQTIDNETLGGAMTHNAISGVAHYRTKDEEECLEKIRELISELPAKETSRVSIVRAEEPQRLGRRSLRNSARRPPGAIRYAAQFLRHISRRWRASTNFRRILPKK